MNCSTVTLHAFYISPAHNFRDHFGKPAGRNPVFEPQEIQCDAGKGIVGDRYYGNPEYEKGQITFFDYAVYQALVDRFGVSDLAPSAMRRNVLIEGVDLNELIGKTFRVGDLCMEGSEECSPCFWMDQAVAKGAEDFLQGRGGLRARILEGGVLPLGEVPFQLVG